MTKKLSLILYAGLILLLANCKGSDGDAGPAGPAGNTGVKGDTGVSVSALIYSTGVDSTDAEGYIYWEKTNLTKEEQTFWNSAVVLAYIKQNQVYSLIPCAINFNTNDQGVFSFSNGLVDNTSFVEISQTDWTGKTAANNKPPIRVVGDVRIVVIPGKLMRTNAGMNRENYNEVIAALGLSEKDVKISRKISR